MRLEDVSQWQGAYDFAAAKLNDQISGVILRVSHGLTEDPTFERNVVAARAAGLRVGYYHYLETTSPADTQAAFFADKVLPHLRRGEDIIPFLDYETAPLSESVARLFLSTAELKLGRVGFYSYLAAITSARFSANMARYPLWLADYTTVKPKAPSPWLNYVLWQQADHLGTKSVDVDVADELAPLLTAPPPPKLIGWDVTHRTTSGGMTTIRTRHPAYWAMTHTRAFRRGGVTYHRVFQ